MSTADDDAVRRQVRAGLTEFLDERGNHLRGLAGDLDRFVERLAEHVVGGKMLRPVFCAWGWRAGGGDAAAPAIVQAAMAIELLHASALLHDDVLDASDQRRGRPTAHRRFADLHTSQQWHGRADSFGAAAAILLGDLCLGWSAETIRSCPVPAEALDRACRTYDLTRDEVIAGQYLDMATQAARTSSVAASLQVVELKSARYTVQRPLQLGAALAGGDDDLLAGLAAYGRPVGAAFQLRDDLLGVFGDPAKTGKPVGDDLREGKRTVLLALGYERAGAADVATLDRLVGDRDLDEAGILEVQRVLRASGADQRVEAMIAERAAIGLEALQTMPVSDPAVLDALAELTTAVTVRVV